MFNARSWLVESAAIGAGALGFEPAFLCSTTRHTAKTPAHEVRAGRTAADTVAEQEEAHASAGPVPPKEWGQCDTAPSGRMRAPMSHRHEIPIAYDGAKY
jgi:hypothetical protein